MVERVEAASPSSALARLLDSGGGDDHFSRCCEGGLRVLEGEASRFGAALRALEPEDDAATDEVVASALVALARERHPGSTAALESFVVEADANPAAPESDGAQTEEWDDEQAFEIARQALSYASDHTQGMEYEAMDRTEADAAEERMDAAAQAGDLEEYKLAARRWASAVRRAAERARRCGREKNGEE